VKLTTVLCFEILLRIFIDLCGKKTAKVSGDDIIWSPVVSRAIIHSMQSATSRSFLLNLY
jgi:hypothetical protein